MFIKKMFGFFIKFFYPNRCMYCDKIIDPGLKVCNDCEKEIKTCSKTQILHIDENHESLCVSAFEYKDKIRDAILRFKFKNCKNYGEPFAEYMAMVLEENVDLKKYDYITSVPLSKQRKRERGYNQSEIIAYKVSELLDIPYMNVLSKVKDNIPQHNLRKEEREQNVKGVYVVANKDNVKNKNILLFDDIITTGNTMIECSLVLYQSDANRVDCFALAYKGFKYAEKSKKSSNYVSKAEI